MSKDFIRSRSTSVSNAEIKVASALWNNDCFGMETQKPFCLLSTKPDFYFSDINYAVYLDGEQVHRNREEKDLELRRLLKKRYGCKIRVITYKAPITKAKLKEVTALILDDVLGYRRS